MNPSFRNAARALAGVALAGAAAVVATGCASNVPSDAVAKVGDTVIMQDQFDHWYESAAKGQQQAGGPPVAPDPPRFEQCVAGLKAAQDEAEGGGDEGGSKKGRANGEDADAEPELSDEERRQLRQQCRQSHEQLKQQVMQFLIQSQWVQQEAENQGVEVTDAEVRKQFEEQKQQAFPKERDYKRFLRTSGSSEQDILFRVKLDALQTKLTEKIQKDQEEVTDEDVEEYYEENKERFSQPERRDLNVVLTKGKARAEAAKGELDDGARFKAVANKYSIDEASKANDGKLPAVAKGQQEQALDEAVFAAKKGEVEGPVKTQFGWYVFQVTDVTPASRQELEEAEETIRGVIRSEREQTALQDFIENFREDFKGKTKCREEYVVAECSNAPEEETETAPDGAPPPEGGAPPEGAPPEGAPQQQAPPPSE